MSEKVSRRLGYFTGFGSGVRGFQYTFKVGPGMFYMSFEVFQDVILNKEVFKGLLSVF